MRSVGGYGPRSGLRSAGALAMARGCCSGVLARAVDYAGGRVRCGAAASGSAQRVARSEPSVTPTNLLFNVAATPGGLLRFARERRLGGPLTGLLVAGTLPGVIAGAVLRVEVFSGQRSFTVIAGLVLLPLGLWLLLGAQDLARPRPAPTRRHRQASWLLALVVGTIGGLYGIGGGSILAPILIALRYSVYEVAPATLAATFLTSVAGIGIYQVLQAVHGGTIAPQWILGALPRRRRVRRELLRRSPPIRLPERNLRRLLGLIACLVAVRYLQTAVASTGSRQQSVSHARPA